jgi:UDP-3-O-[3-hydroxymyristoyl] glucosamine N-acyltransferase
MQITAQQICAMLGGTLEGNPDVIIRKPSKIEESEPDSICFLGNAKYTDYIYTTRAAAVLVSQDFAATQPITTTLIRVADVYTSVSFLLEKFGSLQANAQPAIIHPQALIAEGVTLGANVAIGAFAMIETGAVIGDNCVIQPQVFIGSNANIGQNVTIGVGAKIYNDCVIGNNCTLHANVVIGADGFGFAPQPDGTFKKVPQIGNVVVGDNVEIGANTCIDRATMGSTRIGNGVKLDNLIQIAHNVEIGENTVIAAQTGVAGSTKIGKNCMIGGQVGFGGHLVVADGTQIQGQSGIVRPIKTPNTAVSGTPAFDYVKERRASAHFRQLPELEQRVRDLEKHLKQND